MSNTLLGVSPRLRPELGAEQAVDETVAWAVDDEKQVAEVADDESPERERFLAGFGAFQSILDHKHLVEAEEDPRQVGDEEHEDNAHEDDGKVVLLPPPGNKTIKLFSL